VHFPPIAAATVALSINYYGAFIGNELVGYNSGSWQDFYKLCLQVVAKIHVSWHYLRAEPRERMMLNEHGTFRSSASWPPWLP
jgi:hypothetical protein